MKYKIVSLESIMLVGMELRLNLADEQAAQKIGATWGKLFAEKMPEQVVDAKKPITTMALYTNYDRQGNYSLVIGCPVTSFDNIPNGMKDCRIPAAKYAEFLVAGPFPQAVSDFWQKLWLNKDSIGFQRAFTTDFELYDQRFLSATPEMSIYIAIK